ncbi:MAG TPA: ribonuclease Y [Actinomycetota bacterium]|nr:ribonuclease Y [Actinomycetota bacterium]
MEAGIIFAVVGTLLGITLGFVGGTTYQRKQSTSLLGSAEEQARAIVDDARRQAETARREAAVEARDQALELRQAAEKEALKLRQEVEVEARGRMAEVQRREDRLLAREEALEAKSSLLDRREASIHDREEALEAARRDLESSADEHRRRLEQVAAMTAPEAKAMLVKQIEEEAKRDAMGLVRDLEQQAREEADRRARKIVTLAIQRVASEQTSESTVAVLPLPSDDMKGRIIGREGRNIRAYEAVTGVNLIIDDTPEAVLLSCFDPVRREVGRLTLEKLVSDGRIHPARIEETYERAKGEVESEVRRAGEDACLEVGLTDLHPELVRVLGRLKYRTSYGQNVLRHLVETAHLAGIMASELGLDVKLAKRCGFLHDIGKALTHEIEGSHAIIGAELARRLKEAPEVVHAIEAHHGEVEPRTVEAVLTQSADAISGGRPGARRETLESYVKRLERLEEIANSYPGVEKVFAMQAGREVRIMVKPEQVDDVAAQVLARDMAKRVEQELQYPGQIKITVVREIRSIEYAK